MGSSKSVRGSDTQTAECVHVFKFTGVELEMLRAGDGVEVYSVLRLRAHKGVKEVTVYLARALSC
jgi:hypothetical protein